MRPKFKAAEPHRYPQSMALPRRRRKTGQPDLDDVDLSAGEGVWTGAPAEGKRRRATVEDSARQRVFDEYYADESLFAALDELARPQEDPYVALGLDERASWDQITSAHRRLAKLHHPDRLSDPSSDARLRSEERIRKLNIAYTELRRRRGK